MSVADFPFVELNDLLSIVASYFTINTGSAEREADTAVQSSSRFLYRVSNVNGVAFLDTSRESIKIPNPASRPVDLMYFTFRSNIIAKTADYRTPTNRQLLNFLYAYPNLLVLQLMFPQQHLLKLVHLLQPKNLLRL